MIGSASDWCQRWSLGRHSWRHRSEGGFDASRYDVGPLAEADAKAFVEANHYSGTYPAARLRYGLFDGVWLVGVAVLSIPARARVLTVVFPDLEPFTESLELGRLVIADSVPANAESWFIARTWELAIRAGVRGVVSFSDPLPRRTTDGRLVFPGHIGIIYQASNASYVGRSTPRRLYLLSDGRTLNARALQKIRAGEVGEEYAALQLVRAGARPRRPSEGRQEWLAAALRQAGVRTVPHPGNHRYAFRLGANRRLIRLGFEPLIYPKPNAIATPAEQIAIGGPGG